MSGKAVILRANGPASLVDVIDGEEDTDPNYQMLSDAVAGWIELVRVADDMVMYCNEEGKLMGLPYNHLATLVIKGAFEQTRRQFNDVIVGDVVFVGDDGSPNTVGLSDQWIDFFTKSGVFVE